MAATRSMRDRWQRYGLVQHRQRSDRRRNRPFAYHMAQAPGGRPGPDGSLAVRSIAQRLAGLLWPGIMNRLLLIYTSILQARRPDCPASRRDSGEVQN